MHLCMGNAHNAAGAISLPEVSMGLTCSAQIQFVVIVHFALRLNRVIFMQQCMLAMR